LNPTTGKDPPKKRRMFEWHDAHAQARAAYESWLLYTESNERDALGAKLNSAFGANNPAADAVPAFGECAAAQPGVSRGAV
jgi:hypothetical protein